jgi:pimeloyl-ACP methyl ester carboxylesterase
LSADDYIELLPADLAHDALPDSRLEVLGGIGHFPHVECPTVVVEILDDFIATTGPHADLANRIT